MTATTSDGATAINPSWRAASRAVSVQIETTYSGSPQGCGVYGGRDDDDPTERGEIVKNI